MAEAEPTPALKKSGGKKKWLIIVIVLVVLVCAGAGAFVMLGTSTGTPGSARAAPKPILTKQPQYLPLDPAFVVNFRGDQDHHFLQIGVTLMTHDPEAVTAVKAANPVIRNALLLLFSSQNDSALMSADGKRKLQAQALEAVQQVIDQQIGRPGIEAVYFTSFVMQ